MVNKGVSLSTSHFHDKVKPDITDGVDNPKKSRLEKPRTWSSLIIVHSSKDLATVDIFSFEDSSGDDFAIEMGLACVVCRQMTVVSGNQLVKNIRSVIISTTKIAINPR